MSRIKLVAAGVVVLSLFVVMLVQFCSGPPQRWDVMLAERGAAAFAELPMTPLDSLDAVAERITTHVDTTQAADLNGGDRAAIIQQAATFLTLYFGESEPDRYMAWRRSTGLRLLSREVCDAEILPHDTFHELTGGSLDPDASVEDMYRAFWRGERAGKARRAVGIAGDRAGIVLVTGEVHRGGMPAPPAIAGDLGEEIWHGGRGVGSFAWSRPSPTFRERIEAGDVITVARLAVVCEFADGSRRPIMMNWFRDSAGGAWVLYGIAYMNFVSGEVWNPNI